MIDRPLFADYDDDDPKSREAFLDAQEAEAMAAGLYSVPALDTGETECHAQDQAEIEAQQRAMDEENQE